MNYPILLKIGPVTIHSYGFFLTLAITLGTFLFWRRAKHEGFDEDRILDLALVTLISGLLGARLAFILVNFSVFRGDPFDILRSFSAGLLFSGGAVFGLVGFAVFVRRLGWSFLKLADLAAPALVFAQGVWSLGNIFSGAVPFIVMAEIVCYFLTYLLFLFLIKRRALGTKWLLGTGCLILLYLFLVGAMRFLVGFYKPGATRMLSWDLVFSGVWVVFGGVALVNMVFRKINHGQKETLLQKKTL